MPRNVTAVEAAVEKLFRDTEPRREPPEDPPHRETAGPPKPPAKRDRPSRSEQVVAHVTTTGKDKADKSTRALVSGKINKAERKADKFKASRKPKGKRKTVAVMHLNPKHHKQKVYISPEQRAINKSNDGARTIPLHIPAKSRLGVVGKNVFKLNVPKKGSPPPEPRSVVMKRNGKLKKLLQTSHKHPPKWGKVALLKAA